MYIIIDLQYGDKERLKHFISILTDGRLGGYCDYDIKCVTNSLECNSNICEEKQTGLVFY